MSEKKHIDRLFQEKFKNFDVEPNAAVWNRINSSLTEKKKKRRVIPLWIQIGGIAAGVALFITISNVLFNSNTSTPIVNTKNNTSIDADKKATPSNTSNKNDVDNYNLTDTKAYSNKGEANENSTSAISKKLQNSNRLITGASKKKNRDSTSRQKQVTEKPISSKVAVNETINTSVDTQKSMDNSELKSAIEDAITKNATIADSQDKIISDKGNLDSESILTEKASNDNITNANKPSIEDAIAEENKPIIEKEEKQNRWSIASNVAPVYFGSLGKGSSINNQFNDNPKRGAIHMSYGIVGNYTVSKRLKIRSGINRVNLSQTTSEVLAFSNDGLTSRNTEPQDNAILNVNLPSVSLISSRALSQSSTIPETFNSKTSGDLDQRFGFIEIPLELEYRLIDKKMGINIIGGFSTLFLNKNDIYADINGVSTLIGEANNINSTSFSANFGLGIDYKLSKQWHLNLEPQFKYQINTFNNVSGDFRPFFIGLYTGLQFKF